MSTRVPNRYAEALRPVSASTYCGSPPTKSSYAAASSRGVNLLWALGSTTTLIAALEPRAPGTHRRAVFFCGAPYLLGVDVPSKAGHNRTVSPKQHDDARVACQV